jgi:hypothetical protein
MKAIRNVWTGRAGLAKTYWGFGFLATVALVCPPAAWAANMATCILDKAPGVANDTAAHAVFQLCKSENPGSFDAVPQGSGRGWLSYKSGAACTAKKADETRSNQAAVFIGVACRRLYDEGGPWQQYQRP